MSSSPPTDPLRRDPGRSRSPDRRIAVVAWDNFFFFFFFFFKIFNHGAICSSPNFGSYLRLPTSPRPAGRPSARVAARAPRARIGNARLRRGVRFLVWVFLVLALVGAAVVARRPRLLVIVGALPPLLSLVARVQEHDHGIPEHPAPDAEPSVVGGVDRRRNMRVATWRVSPTFVPVLAAATVGVLAVVTPASGQDPRTQFVFVAEEGDVHTSPAVGAWLEQRIEPTDLLFPYSVPYLLALKESRHARSLPRGQTRSSSRPSTTSTGRSGCGSRCLSARTRSRFPLSSVPCAAPMSSRSSRAG